MSLRPDERATVHEIAQQFAKEEIEAMGTLEVGIKDLEAQVKDLAAKTINLEREIRDLKAEIKKVKEVKPKTIDQSKKYK